jgi:hypothetical protein
MKSHRCERARESPPPSLTNTLWDRKLDSGRQREFDLSPQGSAAASQADGNSGGEHLPREQMIETVIAGIDGPTSSPHGSSAKFLVTSNVR